MSCLTNSICNNFLFTNFCSYIKNKHTYWIKKGIAGPKPQFFFGNAFDPIKNGLAATELQWMKNYGQMYGIYIGLTPALTITEPDLIKQVMIRDLPTVFMNRRKQKFEHEIWSKNLFHSEGDLWKKVNIAFDWQSLGIIQTYLLNCYCLRRSAASLVWHLLVPRCAT